MNEALNTVLTIDVTHLSATQNNKNSVTNQILNDVGLRVQGKQVVFGFVACHTYPVLLC